MIGEHVRNSLGVEPRSEHEGAPSVQEQSLQSWVWRDRNVRIEEQATERQRREHVLDEAWLVFNVMDGEERDDQVKRSFRQWGVQILVEKLKANSSSDTKLLRGAPTHTPSAT